MNKPRTTKDKMKKSDVDVDNEIPHYWSRINKYCEIAKMLEISPCLIVAEDIIPGKGIIVSGPGGLCRSGGEMGVDGFLWIINLRNDSEGSISHWARLHACSGCRYINETRNAQTSTEFMNSHCRGCIHEPKPSNYNRRV